MAILQASPDQPQQSNEIIEEAIESSGASVDANHISSAIMDHMDEQQQKNTESFIDAGKELLFGKETHYQLMDSLKNTKDITKDMGYGAYQLMMALIQQGGMSAQNRPDVTAVIIPSGIILLALAAEFMNASDEFPDISLDQFGEAADIFANMIMRHDPEFMQRMNSQGESEPDPKQPMQPQGGLLNAQQGV